MDIQFLVDGREVTRREYERLSGRKVDPNERVRFTANGHVFQIVPRVPKTSER